MNTYVDWKPHDYVSGDCLECGFAYTTETFQMSLEQVNVLRKELDMRKLRKPPQPVHNLGIFAHGHTKENA